MVKKARSENAARSGEMRTSDEAVRRATGRTWDEWIRWLDERGAAGMSHKQIVALLREQGGVESGWWQQTVTAGYEVAKGRRVEGVAEKTRG